MESLFMTYNSVVAENYIGKFNHTEILNSLKTNHHQESLKKEPQPVRIHFNVCNIKSNILYMLKFHFKLNHQQVEIVKGYEHQIK